MDVIKKLKDERNKSVKETDNIFNLDEIKLLLADKSYEERNILKDAGLGHNINKIEEAVGINLERKKFEETVKDVVFTEQEIKEMCINYRLRFLQSNRFKGDIPPVLGNKIVNFFKKNNIDGMRHEASNKLFIMAPVEAFDVRTEKLTPIPKLDPVIFYKMEDRGHNPYYVMIHKWGNDFTVLRRILGACMRNRQTYFITVNTIIFFALMIISATYGNNPLSLYAFCGCLAVSIGLTYIRHYILFLGDSDYSRAELQKKLNIKLSEYNWNIDILKYEK